jgi:NDP-hexose-3-ketoreductase
MIAIVGFGGHVKKNILPALIRMKVTPNYIVVRNLDKVQSTNTGITFTDNFEAVLNDKDISIVYIATPISTHFELTKKALLKNKNVICEKPLTPNTELLEELYAIANKNEVGLHQVIMYRYHAQFEQLTNAINSNKYGTLTHVVSSFKIPHLNPDDIRYNPHLNGGALLDVGFYPVSLIACLFPEFKFTGASIASEPGYEVDLSGTATFEMGKSTGVASWSIGGCYENQITLEFTKAKLIFKRAFSKPETLETDIEVIDTLGKLSHISSGRDDQFVNMFKYLFSNIKHSHIEQQLNFKIIDSLENIAKS